MRKAEYKVGNMSLRAYCQLQGISKEKIYRFMKSKNKKRTSEKVLLENGYIEFEVIELWSTRLFNCKNCDAKFKIKREFYSIEGVTNCNKDDIWNEISRRYLIKKRSD